MNPTQSTCRLAIVTLLALLPFCASVAAPPRGAPPPADPRAAPAGSPGMSLDEMAARLRRDQGARILSAEEYRLDGQPAYRFKLERDGRVRVMTLRPDGSRVRAPR